MSGDPLRRVERTAAQAAQANRYLEDGIRFAREAGVPLRTIAKAAGMSHEKVRQISGS